jgi:DNA-binding transcriptional LysR family regulator
MGNKDPAGSFGRPRMRTPSGRPKLRIGAIHGRAGLYRSRQNHADGQQRRECHPMLEIDALPALLEVVRNSGLYTILPYSSVEALVRRSEMSVATLEAPQATRRLSLAWPTDRPLSPAGLALQRLVITLVRDHADRFGWRPLAKPLRP